MTIAWHAGFCHEDKIHVAGDDGNLGHIVEISRCMGWLALGQQQIDEQLQVCLPTTWFTNQKNYWRSKNSSELDTQSFIIFIVKYMVLCR